MEKDCIFPRVMKSITTTAFLLTVIFASLSHFYTKGWMLTAAISTGTTFYHFAMRLLVGSVVPRIVKHPEKYGWFQQKHFEPKLYKALKVKRWKNHMPTYNPDSFSLQHNSLDQILHNGCVSEAVHEVIILLSFVPLLFSLRWGVFPVFLITSVLSAAFDCSFVIIQRYNRPRLLCILAKKEASAP